MAYMISTTLNVHWATRIEASSGTEGTLKLTIHGDPAASTEQYNIAEVTIFTEDKALVERLITAINGAAS